jgi:hypothetical protein
MSVNPSCETFCTITSITTPALDKGLNSRAAIPGFECTAHVNRDPVALRDLDRADLEHLGPEARHLEHLLVRDAPEHARVGHHARIAREDALDVGVDLALVRLQRGGDSHPAGVGPAPAQRGDVAVRADPLEAGQHDHGTPGQLRANPLRADREDPRAGVVVVGLHLDLPARKGPRRNPELAERQRQEPDRDLLPGRDHHVVLAWIGVRGDVVHETDEPVGLPVHRRDDDHHVVPRLLRLHDPPRDVADLVRVAEGGSTVLLDNQAQCSTSLLSRPSARGPSARTFRWREDSRPKLS